MKEHIANPSKTNLNSFLELKKSASKPYVSQCKECRILEKMEEYKMKKNIWSAFSLIGFMFLFFGCAIKTIIKCIRERNFSLWLSLLAKVLLWWVGLIMLPAGIASIFIEKVSAFNYIAGNGYSILILAYIYVVGLFITRKLYDWKTDKLEK